MGVTYKKLTTNLRGGILRKINNESISMTKNQIFISHLLATKAGMGAAGYWAGLAIGLTCMCLTLGTLFIKQVKTNPALLESQEETK